MKQSQLMEDPAVNTAHTIKHISSTKQYIFPVKMIPYLAAYQELQGWVRTIVYMQVFTWIWENSESGICPI